MVCFSSGRNTFPIEGRPQEKKTLSVAGNGRNSQVRETEVRAQLLPCSIAPWALWGTFEGHPRKMDGGEKKLGRVVVVPFPSNGLLSSHRNLLCSVFCAYQAPRDANAAAEMVLRDPGLSATPHVAKAAAATKATLMLLLTRCASCMCVACRSLRPSLSASATTTAVAAVAGGTAELAIVFQGP